jgi:tetraacyldisaccharide 4'-kinase
LESVDLVVRHQSLSNYADAFHKGPPAMALQPSQPRPMLVSKQRQPLDDDAQVHAVAGIGNPQRFFDSCKQLGFQTENHPFPDHHRFIASDLDFDDSKPVLMTEKDMVKVLPFANEKFWYLPVSATLSESLIDQFSRLIDKLMK